MSFDEIKDFLEEKYRAFNAPGFIEHDPVSIPHRYTRKEDREIAGFLTATISWGSRVSILRSAGRMMDRMGESPFDFVMSSKLRKVDGSIHRTFMCADFNHFVRALKHVYAHEGGMETLVTRAMSGQENTASAVMKIREVFLSLPHEARVRKHLPDPLSGAAAKRINMYLRWMVRRDAHDVDFGLWRNISMAQLSIPLDVHTGNVARKLGLLTRKQNDWKAVVELDASLRRFDAADPVRYDYALFGLGAMEKF